MGVREWLLAVGQPHRVGEFPSAWSWPTANGYIAISLNEIDQFLEYGIEKEKVSIIPNGIDPEDYKIKNSIDFKKKYGLGDDPFILFMGRLNPIKGPDLPLNASCNVKGKLNNYNLVFAILSKADG